MQQRSSAAQTTAAPPPPPALSSREIHERKVVQIYSSPSRRDFNPTERTRYLNIGYWKEGAQSLDEAAQAMVTLVGDYAQFDGGDRVLDVGCGFGDADLFWMNRFGPQHILGIDINPGEVDEASRRVGELKLAERIAFRVASAVDLPFNDGAFSKVVAVEAAHHFLTREDFFREAYRVLKPGGRLTLTDIAPLPGRKVRFLLNPLNHYATDVYARKLEGIGFTNVAIKSIRDHVFKPYANFLRRRLRRTNIAGLFNVAMLRFFSSRLDYFLVSADKPRPE